MSGPTTPTLNLNQMKTHDSPSNSSLSTFGDIGLDSHFNFQDTPSKKAIPPASLPNVGNWETPPATHNVPLSTPTPSLNGSDSSPQVSKPNHSKIDSFRQWSISAYKCTRQILSEKLGKGSRTVDLELETKIDHLRETQRKYINILRLSRALTSHFFNVVQTQHSLGEAFGELANKSPELQEEFSYNSETQRNLSKNGETLLGALNFFTSSLNTLCNKTMEDTLLTIKQFENARLEYDAYRCDLEELTQGARADATSSRVEESRRLFTLHKERYESLRTDVTIKMKFLDENRVKVMHKQLLLLHNAVSAYFSGNQTVLEATLKQFNIKLKQPNATSPSWLEQQ